MYCNQKVQCDSLLYVLDPKTEPRSGNISACARKYHDGEQTRHASLRRPPKHPKMQTRTYIFRAPPFFGVGTAIYSRAICLCRHTQATSKITDATASTTPDWPAATFLVLAPDRHQRTTRPYRPCVAVYRPHTAHPKALFVPLQGLTVPFFAARAQLKQRHTTTKYPANMDNERKITDHSADALRYLLETQFSRLEGTRRQGSKMVGVAVSAPWVRPDLQTASLFFTKNGV